MGEYPPISGNIDNDWLRQFHYETADFTRGFMLGQYEPDNLIEDFMIRASYELGDAKMAIHDPVWGDELIGEQPHDQLLIELARTDAFRRLQSIEQLSLGKDYATMPNSMFFSRWQHIWGSAVFVRKMVENDDRYDDRQKMVLQLRTLLSDVGHTAFSHLGDWMFQGQGSSEDLHDHDLVDYLKLTGVADILERNGFSVEETIFPDIEDWVECAAPDLCVDRVDYGLREMLRWVSRSIPLDQFKEAMEQPQSIFEITDDGQLILTNQKFARYFTAGFSILSTEHWSHPVHRLQLQLLQNGVQASLVDKLAFEKDHPRDALFAIDNKFYSSFHQWEQVHLQRTMRGLARDQRQIFVRARRNDLNRIFEGIQQDDWEFPQFPDPLKSYTWQSDQYGLPYPANIILDVPQNNKKTGMFSRRDGLHIVLPKLKARSVNPMVRTPSGTHVRFGELEPGYKSFQSGQQEMMAREYEATVLMRQDIADRVITNHGEVMKQWLVLLKRQRSKEALQRIVKEVMPYAATQSFDIIEEVDDSVITVPVKHLGRAALDSLDHPDDA